MKQRSETEILNALNEVFELPEGTPLETTVHVESFAALSMMALAAEQWNVRLDPIKLEGMARLSEVFEYITVLMAQASQA